LVGFWSINEKPTGSKDPYALRRAALGVVRLVVENKLKISILDAQIPSIVKLHAEQSSKGLTQQLSSFAEALPPGVSPDVVKAYLTDWVERVKKSREISLDKLKSALEVAAGVAWFIAERLKISLKDSGARFDLLDSIYSQHLPDDLYSVVRRVEALGKFLDTDDGKNLLAGTKRAENILRIEEKRDKKSHTGAPDSALLEEPEEKALASAIATARKDASAAVAKEDFAAAMSAMAKLRPAVDAFFEKVTVNADDSKLRENRLKLLNEIRQATRAVADFSRIEG